LDAVERFCLWARDNHDVGVWNDFAGTLASLRESLPRLVTANRNLAADDGGRARGPERVHVYEVRSAGATTVLTRGSEDSEVALDPDVYEHLQGGDLVRATRRDGALRLLGCYPPESRPILLV
jgi:hypothetical protein